MAKFEKGVPRAPGAGRKAGTPNKKTQSLIEKCEAKGIDLFEEFLDIISEAKMKGDTPMHIHAVKEAAQYVYPKRKAIEHSVDPKLAEAAQEVANMSKEQQIKLLEEELKKLKGE